MMRRSRSSRRWSASGCSPPRRPSAGSGRHRARSGGQVAAGVVLDDVGGGDGLIEAHALSEHEVADDAPVTIGTAAPDGEVRSGAHLAFAFLLESEPAVPPLVDHPA